ncbi:dephospho-CoA kinase [Georgenia deserti]|uniref:Dephospho-CoA kinase n=1 Tax=Georgenia deserti TaxID=2093781 RepID=A0ABW4L5T8_9MICO
MVRIGLTGGIAAGKSVAARRFGELGAVVIDHDVLAREAVADGSVGLRWITETFGDGVLDAEGALDRAALGAVVFGDPVARERLNAIVHPQVRRLSAEREAAAREAGAETVVHDIPLLVETHQGESFDVLVVVHTPAEERLRRLTAGRGMNEVDAQARIDAQASDDERLAAADVVLDGTGSEENLRRQVDDFWADRVTTPG